MQIVLYQVRITLFFCLQSRVRIIDNQIFCNFDFVRKFLSLNLGVCSLQHAIYSDSHRLLAKGCVRGVCQES